MTDKKRHIITLAIWVVNPWILAFYSVPIAFFSYIAGEETGGRP